MKDFTSPSGSDVGGPKVPHIVYAELQRGESLVEKQVKEARTKCRSIASLLTDAPNPNSKGVLMFKKRRQRAKKYTLTCFGKAEGDRGGETEGETGGETEEEGGSSILSGSELDETGFSTSFDPTWDTGYLDLLDRRSSACPSATTPITANHSSGLDISAYQTPGLASPVCQNPGLAASDLEWSPNPGSRVESNIAKQPISGHPADMTPPAVSLTNGGPVAVSRANVLLTPPTQMPTPSQNGLHGNPNRNPSPNPDPDHHLNANQGVLNRTARPFTPGPASSRASVTSVMFRPPQPKPLTVASKPVAAVSMVTIQPSKHLSGPDTKRAVSSTSLYIPPRSSNGSAPPSVASPPSALSSSSSLPAAPFLQPATGLHPFSPQPAAPPSTPLSPSAPPTMFCSPAQPYAPPTPQQFPPPPVLSSFPCVPASPISPPHHTNMPHASFPVLPSAPPAPPPPPHLSPSLPPYTNMTGALTSSPHNAVAAAPPPQPAAAPAVGDLPVAREQRIAVPASRTGILQDAHRRPNKKPMFAAVQKMDVTPNPDLMCMVQNMDGHSGRGPESGATAAGETGHESGPEEDWLRLGAEACNFMQAQRGSRPPPVAPKPQAPQVPQLAGKGGQLFARRQNRMDRYVVERSPSVAAVPYSPAQTREPSPTPSLPATWKYSSNVRAPPPISYNPLLSPSCPPKAQKKPELTKSRSAGSKTQKKGKSVDVMNHQPYQLNSSLFSYGGGASQASTNEQHGMPGGPQKTARVYEVKRFSTPPPTSNGPSLKVIVPRSATTLGEPLWRSELTSPPPPAGPAPFQPQWASSPLSSLPPPAPTAPLPQLPTFSSPPAPNPVHPPTVSHLLPPSSAQASKQFQSAPELSPMGPCGGSRVTSSSAQPPRVPRPRFSTSSLGLQPSVWRPGSTMQ